VALQQAVRALLNAGAQHVPARASCLAPKPQVNGWKLATTINMSVIFFIFGVTLDSSELLTAVKAWKAVVFGLASMLFLTPLFGFIAVRLPFEVSTSHCCAFQDSIWPQNVWDWLRDCTPGDPATGSFTSFTACRARAASRPLSRPSLPSGSPSWRASPRACPLA
jgi:hypothetical protein